jgi:hypothetical protein
MEWQGLMWAQFHFALGTQWDCVMFRLETKRLTELVDQIKHLRH